VFKEAFQFYGRSAFASDHTFVELCVTHYHWTLEKCFVWTPTDEEPGRSFSEFQSLALDQPIHFHFNSLIEMRQQFARMVAHRRQMSYARRVDQRFIRTRLMTIIHSTHPDGSVFKECTKSFLKSAPLIPLPTVTSEFQLASSFWSKITPQNVDPQ
jgi:hypothetical protein